MKIKYNIPNINEIKNNIKNIGNKIKKNKGKVPIKYYALLILMSVIGIITFLSNVETYNNITSEKYTKYDLNDLKNENNIHSNDTEIVDENEIFDIAMSSISTNVANFIDEENKKGLLNTNYIWPIKGEVIKEHAVDELVYSKTLDMWRIHPGIDIAAEIEEEVIAIQDGKIISKKIDGFYGNVVEIEHVNGYVSVYSNLDEFYSIEEGDNVKQGDVIGKVGCSAQGEIEDEIHLHFEILKDNEWINPLDILE